MSAIRFETVGIVGVGLIGASFGLALRERGVCSRVVGVDIDPQAITVARARGALDEGGTRYELLDGAAVVVLAVPPSAVVDTGLRAAAVMRRGAILVDVASVKGPIVRAMETALPTGVHYVGGHPMAGSEAGGAAAADAGLLVGRPFLITPTAQSDPGSVDVVRELVRALGMHGLLIDADVHDTLMAQVSHVPYLLGVAAVNAASDEALGLSGPTFAGLRRVAASPVELWADICTQNRGAILRALGWVREELDRLERALAEGTDLTELLTQARRRAGAEG